MTQERSNIVLLLVALAVLGVLADTCIYRDRPDEALAVFEEDRRQRIEMLGRVNAAEDSVASRSANNQTLFAQRARMRAALIAARPPRIPVRSGYLQIVHMDDRLLAEMYAEVALREDLGADYRRLSELYEQEARARDAATQACRQAVKRRRVRRTLMTVAVTAGITLLIVES